VYAQQSYTGNTTDTLWRTKQSRYMHLYSGDDIACCGRKTRKRLPYCFPFPLLRSLGRDPERPGPSNPRVIRKKVNATECHTSRALAWMMYRLPDILNMTGDQPQAVTSSETLGVHYSLQLPTVGSWGSLRFGPDVLHATPSHGRTDVPSYFAPFPIDFGRSNFTNGSLVGQEIYFSKA
jgi:hypothetical protein